MPAGQATAQPPQVLGHWLNARSQTGADALTAAGVVRRTVTISLFQPHISQHAWTSALCYFGSTSRHAAPLPNVPHLIAHQDDACAA